MSSTVCRTVEASITSTEETVESQPSGVRGFRDRSRDRRGYLSGARGGLASRGPRGGPTRSWAHEKRQETTGQQRTTHAESLTSRADTRTMDGLVQNPNKRPGTRPEKILSSILPSFSARASRSSHRKILCRRTTKRKNTQRCRITGVTRGLWLDPGITRTEGTENRAAIERMRQRRGRVIADGGGSRYQIECREKTRRDPAEDGVSGLQEPERERR